MVKNLKLLRTQKGVSQQQLADVIGASQQSINKYENHGVEPDINTLIALADFFETSVDYLIGYTEINHKIEPIKRFDLNRDEADLIDGYRLLTKSEQNSIMIIVENYNKTRKV